jgi:hypothetical protein
MGLEAANNVIRQCGTGIPASIIPLEPEEAHVTGLRDAIRTARQLAAINPLAQFLPTPLA